MSDYGGIGWCATDPDCHYGNHLWRGSVCSVCGERLRCACGRFWRVDDDRHFDTCSVFQKLVTA